MSEILWPPELIPSRTDISVLDSVGRFSSPLNGLTQTVGRPGSRLKMSLSLNLLKDRSRAMMQGLITASRGGTKPIRVQDHTYTRAGSFSGAELLPNPTFASGTTGYTMGSSWASSVQDRHMRVTRLQNTGAVTGIARVTNTVSVTTYLPYAARALVMPGRGPYDSLQFNFGSSSFGSEYASVTGFSAGLFTAVFVPTASTTHISLGQGVVTAVAGDFLDVSYLSFARCGLVDNGPNMFPDSANLTDPDWTPTRASVSSSSAVLPDGSTGTTNVLHEDATAGNTHLIQDGVVVSSSTNIDFCFAVALRALNRTWAQIRMSESIGGEIVSVYVNLSTGATGTEATGSNWSNLRKYVVDMGNGWYYVCLIARKTNAATTVNCQILIAEADNDNVFNGLDQHSIVIWRPSVAQSSLPIRLTATAGTAHSTGNSQDLGGGLYTKGWEASVAGLFKKGDQVEIGGQLIILSENVDSDASGRAFLPFPSIRRAPADNEPVIAVNPMAKMIPEESENGWTTVPGLFSDSELVLVETG